ncbi:hypothetical protein GMST_18560 [Geomonas silvestris]|uniref:Negative regulator of flagellin synthesis n=1 Tax=Geomonas silvestris TaxID=2740184 RepID=A0A6V8MHQ4_9BACT|nr:flagellar biosynthesis anti-sigma factor FlgM [Geomonas silvestris]GFO59531.1 hypothetical protein GMST_18560 [Geomonas silvestris]
MKIVPAQQHPTLLAETPASTQKSADTPPQKAASPGTPTADRVQLSDAAQWRLKVQPADQAQRLAHLKASIAAGTYQVSSRLVAEKMLADGADL